MWPAINRKLKILGQTLDGTRDGGLKYVGALLSFFPASLGCPIEGLTSWVIGGAPRAEGMELTTTDGDGGGGSVIDDCISQLVSHALSC